VSQAHARLRKAGGTAAAAISRPGLFHALQPKECKAAQSASTNTLVDFLLLNAPSCWVHSLDAKRSMHASYAHMSQSQTMRADTTWSCLHEGVQQAGAVAYVVVIGHAAAHPALQLVQVGQHFDPPVGIWLLK